MTVRVTVNRELCVGSGNCVELAPKVFDQDDQDGLVVLRTTEPPEGFHEAVELATHMCPVGAIDVQWHVPAQ